MPRLSALFTMQEAPEERRPAIKEHYKKSSDRQRPKIVN
jgi:hypothetical protein